MRILMITVMCICGMFFLTSCNKEVSKTEVPKVENYIVNKVEGPLTEQEIETCFNTAGLEVDRIEIMLPEKSGVTFTTETFRNGVSDGIGAIGTSYVYKGLERFMLCKKQKGDELSFLVGSMGFIGPDIKGYKASWGMIPVTKPVNTEKQPIYFLGANKTANTIFSAEDFNLETYVNKYDIALVIYISLSEWKM